MQDYFSDYYLEIAKTGEAPKWPRPEEELDIHSQPLGGGFTQYWAYPKGSEVNSEDLPHAEVVASGNPAHTPVILIDQLDKKEGDQETMLELVLAKDGHAWGKTNSSVANLEDNLSSLLEYGKNNLNLEVEHFMTTSKVSHEVEKKLDDLEAAAGGEVEHAVESSAPQTAVEQTAVPQSPSKPEPVFGGALSDPGSPTSSTSSGKSSSKLGVIIPIVVLLALFGGVVLYRDQIMGKINSFTSKAPTTTPTPTPTSAPTPTPTSSIERSNFKVRVLNGTTKAGAAGALADKLKELGWQILSTGNATNQNTAKTTIKAKEATVSAILVTDIKDDYQATVAADLKASDRADAEITIGKE